MELEKALNLYKKNFEKPRLDCFGGYPSLIDTGSIAGYVIIASTIDGGNEPDLDVYIVEDFIREMDELEMDNETEDDDNE